MPKSNSRTETKPKAIQFETLAEDAPVMLWLTNVDGEIIFSNTKWKNFIGSEKVNEEGGNAWYEALHPDDKENCLRTFREAFASHKHFEMEYRLKRLDGEYRNILDTGEPYIENDGRFAGFIGSSTDMTERKMFEEQLSHSHKEMTQHNIEMRLINKINSYLQVCISMEETYPVIYYYARELFPNCTGALYLLNDKKTIVESVVTWGEQKDNQIPVITMEDCWSLRQGKVHTVNDNKNGLVCNHLTECPEYGYTCVPIIAQGEMVGMLHLQFPKYGEDLLKEDILRQVEARQRLVNMTADNLALALVSLKLREALEAQSISDPLTHLYNRRFMEETLEKELPKCIRNKTTLGILMLDIDHFKSFNDNYGHEAGDLVLIEFAKLISGRLRKGDIACRYGGEEFMIIMPGAPLHVLEDRAELIRNNLKKLKINYQKEILQDITVSIGIAIAPDHGDTQKALIKSADMALYEAKETRRDKAVVAKPLNNRYQDRTQEPIEIAKAS